MNHDCFTIFDEFSYSENSTTVSEINYIKLLYAPNKNKDLLNMFTNKNPAFTKITNPHGDISEEKMNQKMLEVFLDKQDNEEFNLFSIKDDENSINDSKTIGKKHSRESTSSYISHIYHVNNNKKNNIFEINKINKNDKEDKYIYRLDYYKKDFLKDFLEYLLKNGKKLISECKFKEKFKLKLHMPNYKLYAGNPKEKDNKEFLKKTIKKVFIDYNKNDEKGTSRQKDNEKLIEYIYEDKNFPSSIEEIALNNFFNMTIEEGMKNYYDFSEEFLEFKKREKIQYYDKMFYHEKNRHFSLLQNYGYIRLVNLPFYSNNPK